MQQILITGGNGQLGHSLRRIIENDPEIEAFFTDVENLDITDREAVNRFVASNKISVIINCAAYTAVDKAESDELLAAKINTEAVGIIAECAAKYGVKVIHVSTDYVFSGENYRPYMENDEPYPHTIYGRTKLEGEGLLSAFCADAVIIRTAWLYSEYGHNFVKTMLRLADEGKDIRVVSDQIGTPTYAGDLADVIHKIIHHPTWHPGIYHFTDEGVASWYDFTKAILRLSGKNNVTVTPVSTREYPTAARRPLYSVLSKEKIKNTFGIQIPYWEDALAKCLKTTEDIEF